MIDEPAMPVFADSHTSSSRSFRFHWPMLYHAFLRNSSVPVSQLSSLDGGHVTHVLKLFSFDTEAYVLPEHTTQAVEPTVGVHNPLFSAQRVHVVVLSSA